jgi:hypothetical protein
MAVWLHDNTKWLNCEFVYFGFTPNVAACHGKGNIFARV